MSNRNFFHELGQYKDNRRIHRGIVGSGHGGGAGAGVWVEPWVAVGTAVRVHTGDKLQLHGLFQLPGFRPSAAAFDVLYLWLYILRCETTFTKGMHFCFNETRNSNVLNNNIIRRRQTVHIFQTG